MAIHKRIQSRMKELGLSQADLIRLTGLSQTGVQNAIRGKSPYNARILKALSDALDVPVSWLLDEDVTVHVNSWSSKKQGCANMLALLKDDEVESVIEYINYHLYKRKNK